MSLNGSSEPLLLDFDMSLQDRAESSPQLLEDASEGQLSLNKHVNFKADSRPSRSSPSGVKGLLENPFLYVAHPM